MSKSDPKPQLTIIPAQPGYRLIHDVDGMISVGDDVIAWQITSHWDQGEFHTMVEPVLIEGTYSSDRHDYLHPDNSITFALQRFNSLKDAQNHLTRSRVNQPPQ